MLCTGAGSRSFSHLEAVVSLSEKSSPSYGEGRGARNSVPGELQRVAAVYYR